MRVEVSARDQLLARVMAFAATEGIAGRSLREIAHGADSSHRMLLYHFGSHAGLLAAIVATIEAQQRELLAALAEPGRSAGELMLGLWQQLTRPELLPFVRLFFEVFGLVAQGAPGTEGLRETLTRPWLVEGGAIADELGLATGPAELRLGVAVARGLLLDLVAGADLAEVDLAYRRFVYLWEEADGHRPADQHGRDAGAS
jgi:AcrR family transcriptional regulator